VLMKVERPCPEVPPKFHRLYMSFAAMKKGFLDGCRSVIGVDGCFLKGPFKGMLLVGMATTICTRLHMHLLKPKPRTVGLGSWKPWCQILEHMIGMLGRQLYRIDRR